MSVTWHQSYDGGRIVARLGQMDVGAVFPGNPARWRLWIGGVTQERKGSEKTELSAKCALLGAIYDWLYRAGLQMKGGEP